MGTVWGSTMSGEMAYLVVGGPRVAHCDSIAEAWAAVGAAAYTAVCAVSCGEWEPPIVIELLSREDRGFTEWYRVTVEV